MSRGHRPYWRSIRTYWYWFVVIALLVFQWFVYPPTPGPPQRPTGREVLTEGVRRVDRVVDGDTLRMESGARVRLQGVDTPETVREDYPVEAWGPEASQFTKDFVRQAGGRVKLTFGNERLDNYGRYLAFVWDGDRLLNEELVRAGLAKARLGGLFSSAFKRRLRLAQEEAQRAKRGIWSNATPAPIPTSP
jgi:endonuclease YncB( thermonuclease family)